MAATTNAFAAARLEVSVAGTSDDFFMLSSNNTSAGDRFIVKNNGRVGIGTTSPFALFTIFATTTGSTASPSTLFQIASSSAGTATTTLFSISNTGTTTASNGFNITGGCFALNNTCLSTGGSNYFSNSGNNTTLSTGFNLNVPSNGFFGINNNLLAYASTTNGATVFGLFAGGQNATTSATVAGTSAFGYQALNAINTGTGNTGIGYQALLAATSSSQNTAVGYQALKGVDLGNGVLTGGNNTGVGYQVLSAIGGSGNTAVGSLVGASVTSGSNNSIVGYNIGGSASSFTNNALVGANIFSGVTSIQSNNSALGYNTLSGSGAHNYNVAIGSNALSNLLSNGAGNNNIVIGPGSLLPDPTLNDQLNIGNVLFGLNIYDGSGSTSALPTANGKIGIGTTSPYAKLTVQANNGDTLRVLFAVASSTATATSTHFIVTNNGLVGVGTSSPWGQFSINPNALGSGVPEFVIGSSSATRLLVSGSGFVGIGTTTQSSTAEKVAVYGNLLVGTPATGNSITLQRNTASASNVIYFDSGDPTGNGVILRDNSNNFGLVSRNNLYLIADYSNSASSAIIFQANSATYGAGTELGRFTDTGNFGVGTTSPFAGVSIQQAVATPQLAVAYDTTKYNTFQTDSATGDLFIAGSSKNIRENDGNLFVCTGGSCPTGSPSGQGNIIAETKIGIATSTPIALLDMGNSVTLNSEWLYSDSSGAVGFGITSNTLNIYTTAGAGSNATITFGKYDKSSFTEWGRFINGKFGVGSTTPWSSISVGSGGAITVAENNLATPTSMTIDWRNGNQQLVRIGTSGTTISFSGYTDGQKLMLVVCNPGSTAGGISWGTSVLWSGGTAPTQTTTANKCDIWSFVATKATSTMVVLGAQSANF